MADPRLAPTTNANVKKITPGGGSAHMLTVSGSDVGFRRAYARAHCRGIAASYQALDHPLGAMTPTSKPPSTWRAALGDPWLL